jgi:hypothetical protein
MKNLGVVLCLVFAATLASADKLQILANPTNPILIPSGTPIGGAGPAAPYFTINDLTLKWTGENQFQLLAILLTSKASKKFACGGSGAQTSSLFAQATVNDCNGNVISNAINSNGEMIMPGVFSSCALEAKSMEFFCDHLPFHLNKNPFSTYNIPVTLTVIGQEVDPQGSVVTKITAREDLVIQ